MIEAELYDGTVLEFPDDTDPGVIQSTVKRETARVKGFERTRSRMEDAKNYAPTAGMSTGEKFAAGAGKALVDIGRGAGQLVGAVSREDVAASRERDAPLMETTAGQVGNFAGNVAAVVPTMAIPGANTVAGAGAIGAGLGLLQPSASTGETVQNVALGGAVGAAGQKVGQMIASKGAKIAADRTAQAAATKAENIVRDTTLAQGRKLGYRFPLATVNQTSTAARAADSLSGRAATDQTSAYVNQKITNRVIRQDLGLPKNAPLTAQTLSGVRKQAGQVYEAVAKAGRIVPDAQYVNDMANLGSVMDDVAKEFPGATAPSGQQIKALADSLFQPEFDAGAAVKYVRGLREQAKSNFKAVHAAEGGAEKLALARAQTEAAGALEDMILRHLRATGKSSLADSFDKARVLIAKAHDAEQALNPGTGNIVATKLGGMLRRGKPLGGNFELVAKVAAAVPHAMREQTSGPGVSAISGMLSTLGAGGAVLTGNPLWGAAAAIPVARGITRAAIMSPAAQRLAAPSYAPSLMGPRALTFGGTALEPTSLAALWAYPPEK